jgi:hypothetical protein
MELARCDDEEECKPLFEGRVYRREVPTVGDPQDAARARLVRAPAGHFTGFFIVGVVMFKLTAELAARPGDLEEQTSDRELAALAATLAEARARRDHADQAADRRLFERQVEVLEGRVEAIAKAVRVLERLRVRREVAEHQLKQLRLDLSRGAASGLDVPELNSRLEFIRYEIDAREEVEEIGARRDRVTE